MTIMRAWCWCLIGILPYVIYEVYGWTKCADGWVLYKQYCYKFGQNDEDFDTAAEYCSQQSSHPVEVYSKAENHFIKEQLRLRKASGTVCYWIGMKDERIENLWRWYTHHREVNFTDWDIFQPGRDGEQDCAVFYSKGDYRWHDHRCTSNCTAVCQKRGTLHGSSVVG